MKKTIFLTSLAILALSCAKEQEIPETPAPEGGKTEFSASLPDTKVCLGEKDGDSYPTLWQAGDQISVNGAQSDALTADDGYSGTSYAKFTINGVVSAPYCSAYPASAVSGYSSGSATITIPAQQTYVAGQYDSAAYIMVGNGSSPSLSFQPQMALFKLTPTAPEEGSLKITSIRLESLGTEKMSGAFTTDFSSLSGGTDQYVAVEAPSGGLDFGTPFILAIPAQTYASGLRFVITADDDTSMSFSRTSSFTAAPGTLYPLTAPAYVPSAVVINGHWMVNSSAITLRWNCSNPAMRGKKPWRVHVYSDSECTTEIRTYDLPASESWINGDHNRFVVAGLAQGTTYWFRIEDVVAGALSDPVSESTAPFTVATMPTSDITSPGLVFAEDFSEYAWGNDYLKNGNGYIPSDKSSFSNRSLDGATIAPGEMPFRDNAITTAIASSRLANWLSEQNVYIHPGYMKLGTSSNSGFVLTPKFPIEDGKTALVDVTVSISRYDTSQSNDWMLCVVSNDGDKGGRQSDFSWPDITDSGLYRIVSTTKVRSDSNQWDKITISGLRVQRNNRIAFGRTKPGSKTTARVLLDDISVEVKALSTSSLFAYPSSGITSSTIPFTWNGDPSHAFTATLYSDAACTQTVASFSIPASDNCWNGNQPNYVFGGLTPNTAYYFKVEDTTDSVVSNVATATTEAFSIVQMPASITATGVALAEDFGELRWHSDLLANAAGFVPSNTDSFSSTAVANFIKGTSATGEIEFATCTDALGSSRLSGWAVDSKVFFHCGYLKLGESSNKGWILTPQFTVPGGKKAIVKVTVTAAKFNSSQEDNWAIAVLNETEANMTGTYTASFDWPVGGSADKYQTVGLGTSWTTVTVEGLAVLPGDRIAFGARSGASSSKSRVYISDIKVEVTGIVDDPVRVTVLETSSSTVAVEWTEGTSAANDKTKSYNASLYDNPECTGSPVRSFDFAANASYWNADHSPRFVFTGLAANTMYYVKVTDGSNRASDAVAAKTKAFTVMTMPSSITETGLAFAEDFSELCWNSDYVNSAVGIDPANGTTLTTQTPLDSGEPYDDANRTAIYWQLFKQNARPSSRLADWLYDAEGSDRSGSAVTSIHNSGDTGRPVMVGPGYLQLGARREVSSGKYDCAKAWIITPALPIPSGKVATVDVKITAATPGSQTNKWVIATTNSGTDYGSGWLSFSWKDKTNTSYYQKVTLSSKFKEYTKTLLLEEGDRILVGPSNDFSNPTWKDNTNAAKTFDPIMFLSDITVTVTAIEDNGELVTVNAGIE